MNINLETGVLKFENEFEEKKLIKAIFGAFLNKQDRELTQKWLQYESNYDDFKTALSEVLLAHMILLQSSAEFFKLGVLDNKSFINFINGTSPQIAKIMVVVLNSIKASFKSKNAQNLSKDIADKMYDQLIAMFSSKIDYNFQYGMMKYRWYKISPN